MTYQLCFSELEDTAGIYKGERSMVRGAMGPFYASAHFVCRLLLLHMFLLCEVFHSASCSGFSASSASVFGTRRFFVEESCLKHCRIFSNISCFYSLDANNYSPSSLDNWKTTSRCFRYPEPLLHGVPCGSNDGTIVKQKIWSISKRHNLRKHNLWPTQRSS